jgi:hypothetical protein
MTGPVTVSARAGDPQANPGIAGSMAPLPAATVKPRGVLDLDERHRGDAHCDPTLSRRRGTTAGPVAAPVVVRSSGAGPRNLPYPEDDARAQRAP